LEAYAKYDYLLSISRKALVAEYFPEDQSKASLETLRERL